MSANPELSQSTIEQIKLNTSAGETEGIKKTSDSDTKYYFRGFLFIVFLMLDTILVVLIYWRSHGISPVAVLTQVSQSWPSDFVGGIKTPFAMGVEIFTWSIIGVNCRMAYIVGQVIINKQFSFGKNLVICSSAQLFGPGISLAVIFCLQIIEVSVAGVHITLANAPIETVVAISFILGFYFEDARKLLDRVRGQLGLENKPQ
ncbi:MAG: hypothetical protein U0350_18010 [Caldilineaceae bacterium]